MTNKVSTSFCVLLLIVKHLELDQTKMYLKHSNYYKPTCLEMALKSMAYSYTRVMLFFVVYYL